MGRLFLQRFASTFVAIYLIYLVSLSVRVLPVVVSA